MDPQAIDYKNIPVQADVIAGILRLDVESATCFRDLDRHVHSDQGVAALVLRVVNSALYSRGNQIATIPRAITVLGFQVVRSLAMLAFSRSLFAQTRDPLLRGHIWQHSLLVGIAGREIAVAEGQRGIADEVFVAGLMHDIGKVLLAMHDAARYQQVVARVLETRCTSVVAEREVFGCDHCAVGREAAAQWRLPERFAAFMGTDLATPDAAFLADPVCRGLAVANRLIIDLGLGGRPVETPEAGQAALAALGVAPERSAPWFVPEFLAGLMDHDAYRLCAAA